MSRLNPSLQEMMAHDVETACVFFSDFAEPHDVNGAVMDCVICSTKIGESRSAIAGRTFGLNAKDVERTTSPVYADETVMFVRASDFGPRPPKDFVILLDRTRRCIVLSCEGERMFEIRMKENRV